MPEDSDRSQLTLYINYLGSNTSNNSTQVFSDGEPLTCNEIITSGLLGNTSIAAGAPFAVTIANNAAVTGSSYQIQNGVYFIRGNFVNVSQETLILSQYEPNSNYRVGLQVIEEIVNADIDESLNDNSQGFNNYSAPGADRLKISCSLFKKPLDDFQDTSGGTGTDAYSTFTELSSVEDGVLKNVINSNNVRTATGSGGSFTYDLTDTLARRTFDESGNYLSLIHISEPTRLLSISYGGLVL